MISMVPHKLGRERMVRVAHNLKFSVDPGVDVDK